MKEEEKKRVEEKIQKEKNEKKKDDGKEEDGKGGEDEEGDDADSHDDHDGPVRCGGGGGRGGIALASYRCQVFFARKRDSGTGGAG